MGWGGICPPRLHFLVVITAEKNVLALGPPYVKQNGKHQWLEGGQGPRTLGEMN